MSSTNRGGTRSEADFYCTPDWVIRRLIEGCPLPGGRWLEPCAGDGQIIRTVNEMRPSLHWSAGELREEMRSELEPLTPNLYIGDFLAMPEGHFGPDRFDVSITNPPFSLALPIIQKSLRVARRTAMLLRLNFWGSAERAAFLRTHAPDTYILPQRPTFSLNKQGKVGTDSIEYAWFVFRSEQEYAFEPRATGKITVLGDTSIEERRAWTKVLKERFGLVVPSLEEACDPL